MSDSTQPSLSGITAQASTASTKELVMRGHDEHRLVRPGGHDDLLDHVFERVGNRLQQAVDAHHVGAAPHLHRRPDLAVAINEEQQRHHHEADHGEALREDQHEGAKRG